MLRTRNVQQRSEHFVFVVVEEGQDYDDNDEHQDDEDHEGDVAADHAILENQRLPPPLPAPGPSHDLLLNICPRQNWLLKQ